MSRILCAAVALLVIGAGLVGAEDGKVDPCCLECRTCQSMCQMCAADCLDELAKGDASRKDCIKLCQDCADICGACANIGSRKGPLEANIAVLCAEACEKCAAECGKHKDDKTCQACAEQCRKCAKECRTQSKK